MPLPAALLLCEDLETALEVSETAADARGVVRFSYRGQVPSGQSRQSRRSRPISLAGIIMLRIRSTCGHCAWRDRVRIGE